MRAHVEARASSTEPRRLVLGNAIVVTPTHPLELVMCTADLPPSRNGGLLPRKNSYYAIHRGRLHRSKHATDFVLCLQIAAARAGLRPDRGQPPIRFGWWALDLLVVAPARLRTFDVLLPRIDSDACLAPVRDALQYAGLLDDDARIVRDRTWTARGRPEVRIRLKPVDDPDPALAGVWPGIRYFGGRGC
jgi:hypothetical protein